MEIVSLSNSEFTFENVLALLKDNDNPNGLSIVSEQIKQGFLQGLSIEELGNLYGMICIYHNKNENTILVNEVKSDIDKVLLQKLVLIQTYSDNSKDDISQCKFFLTDKYLSDTVKGKSLEVLQSVRNKVENTSMGRNFLGYIGDIEAMSDEAKSFYIGFAQAHFGRLTKNYSQDSLSGLSLLDLHNIYDETDIDKSLIAGIEGYQTYIDAVQTAYDAQYKSLEDQLEQGKKEDLNVLMKLKNGKLGDAYDETNKYKEQLNTYEQQRQEQCPVYIALYPEATSVIGAKEDVALQSKSQEYIQRLIDSYRNILDPKMILSLYRNAQDEVLQNTIISLAEKYISDRGIHKVNQENAQDLLYVLGDDHDLSEQLQAKIVIIDEGNATAELKQETDFGTVSAMKSGWEKDEAHASEMKQLIDSFGNSPTKKQLEEALTKVKFGSLLEVELKCKLIHLNANSRLEKVKGRGTRVLKTFGLRKDS